MALSKLAAAAGSPRLGSADGAAEAPLPSALPLGFVPRTRRPEASIQLFHASAAGRFCTGPSSASSENCKC